MKRIGCILLAALTILLWQTGAALADGTGPVQRLGTGVPLALAAAPDGAELAVGSTTGVWLLDARSLQPQRLLQLPEAVSAVRYSADGRYLQANQHIYDRSAGAWTIADDSTMAWLDPNCTRDARYCFAARTFGGTIYSRWVKDTVLGVEVQQLSSGVQVAAWSADGRAFYSILSGGEIAAWAFQSGVGVQPWLAHLAGFFTNRMDLVDWSTDGASLTAGENVWDIATGQVIGHPACPFCSVRGPACDCGWPAVRMYSAYYLYLYDDALGYQSRILVPHHVETMEYAQSSDGQWLATSGADAETATTVHDRYGDYITYQVSATSTRIWNRATLSQTAQFPGLFYHMAVSPHGEIMVGMGDSGVEAWDTRTQQRLWTMPGSRISVCQLQDYAHFSWCWYLIGQVTFSPDGTIVALTGPATGNAVILVRADTGQPVATLTGHTESVGWFAFSPSGRQLAADSGDGTVLIWDVPATTRS